MNINLILFICLFIFIVIFSIVIFKLKRAQIDLNRIVNNYHSLIDKQEKTINEQKKIIVDYRSLIDKQEKMINGFSERSGSKRSHRY